MSGSDDFDGELWDYDEGGYGGSVFCFHGYPGNSKQVLFGIFDGHRGAIATELTDLSKYIIDEVLWDYDEGGYGGSVFCFHGYPGNSKQALFGIFDGHRGAIATELADLSKYIIDEVPPKGNHFPIKIVRARNRKPIQAVSGAGVGKARPEVMKKKEGRASSELGRGRENGLQKRERKGPPSRYKKERGEIARTQR
ncbi:hypothetical protein NL676_004082 [Syzygium grande]|nr:hypothetical protein NL676_004082 [Syzygium grande]